MSFTTATDTERKNISVWFECKSCQFTFPFRTVAEFLDHKKQKHLAEFQKAQCIVFEERLQDELITNYSDQHSETKLFAQDDDVELCSGVQEIFSEIAELSSVKTLPLPVSALHQVLPQQLNQADQILNDSTLIAVEAHHPVCILVDVENNSGIISPDHLSEDFSFVDDHDGNINVPTEVVGNVENTDNRNLTSPNPYVSLRRLSAKELLASNRSNNLKNTLTRVDIVHGPFACDISLTEADPLTLREWLIQQKLTSQKSNNSTENPEAVNIIRLDPDPTEMDDATDKAFKISGETPIKCKLCNKYLESDAEVKVHVMHCWLGNKKRHCYCVPCNKVLSSPGALKSHTKAMHAEGKNDRQREYKCHICLKPFKAFYVLKNHLVTHKNKEERERDASFVCDTCGKPYFNKNDLARHIVAHSEDRPFKCSSPNCTAAFKFKRFLTDHLKTHLPKPQNVPKLICCPKEGCTKLFTTQKVLRFHLKTILHTGEPVPKSWKCDQKNCDKLYSFKESLNRHRIAAHGVGGDLLTFQCQICNKTFAWRRSLMRHLGSHTGERRFKCSYDGCEKVYRDKKSLDEHFRGKHTEERPFQCELCGKAYYRAICLRVHMGVHRKRKQAGTE